MSGKARPLGYAGPPFRALHDELMGESALGIDFSAFDPSKHAPEHIELAQRVWQERVRTEFRSIGLMSRFLTETVGAGDPLDVYAGAVEFVADEIRHVALCASLVRALGATPEYPDPPTHPVSEALLKAPMPVRALNTALSMLCVSETISVGFIRDLHDRCADPIVGAVLTATLEDEGEHGEWGWTYAEKSLSRFPESTRPDWKRLVRETAQVHHDNAQRILAGIPAERRRLAAWPEPELANLGLFSPERQALVFEATWERELVPRLRRLKLL